MCSYPHADEGSAAFSEDHLSKFSKRLFTTAHSGILNECRKLKYADLSVDTAYNLFNSDSIKLFFNSTQYHNGQ